MFSKNQGRKKRQQLDNIFKGRGEGEGGVTAVVFQLLDKFGMLT